MQDSRLELGLLSEIENSVTNSSVPVADILRKCKVLAARLSHKELADWATNELNGYPDGSEIPEYRKITYTPPIGDFQGPYGSALKNYPIPIFSVPEPQRSLVQGRKMHEPVASIEELAKSEEGSLHFNWSGDLIALMQRKAIYQGMALVHAGSQVSKSQLNGILDTIRTRVLDYVLAIQVENSDADSTRPGETPPISHAVLNQTFHTTIVGGQANIGGHGAQNISDINQNSGPVGTPWEDPNVQKLVEQLKTASATLEAHEIRELDAALGYVEDQVKSPSPDLERVKSYLDIAGKVAKLTPVAHKIYEHLLPIISKI